METECYSWWRLPDNHPSAQTAYLITRGDAPSPAEGSELWWRARVSVGQRSIVVADHPTRDGAIEAAQCELQAMEPRECFCGAKAQYACSTHACFVCAECGEEEHWRAHKARAEK